MAINGLNSLFAHVKSRLVPVLDPLSNINIVDECPTDTVISSYSTEARSNVDTFIGIKEHLIHLVAANDAMMKIKSNSVINKSLNNSEIQECNATSTDSPADISAKLEACAKTILNLFQRKRN